MAHPGCYMQFEDSHCVAIFVLYFVYPVQMTKSTSGFISLMAYTELLRSAQGGSQLKSPYIPNPFSGVSGLQDMAGDSWL